jgi:hypothetical protein
VFIPPSLKPCHSEHSVSIIDLSSNTYITFVSPAAPAAPQHIQMLDLSAKKVLSTVYYPQAAATRCTGVL